MPKPGRIAFQVPDPRDYAAAAIELIIGRRGLDDVEHLLAEGPHQLLGISRSHTPGHAVDPVPPPDHSRVSGRKYATAGG
jgi:hypothetical protein